MLQAFIRLYIMLFLNIQKIEYNIEKINLIITDINKTKNANTE